MSEHRRAGTPIVRSSVPRRRRWLVGAIGALGASGLMLGGMGVPVSADSLNAGADLHASAEVHDGCLNAVVGSGGVDGSVLPQDDTTSPLEAAGQATATVSVCPDDSGGTPLEDLGGSVQDELDEIVPGDPGGSGAELIGVITAALDSGPLGDGDGSAPGDPQDGLPGDLGDALPGGLGGFVPAGLGLVPGILDRLPMVVPGTDTDHPGGTGGEGPAVNTSAGGTTSESVAVGGIDAEVGGPTGQLPDDNRVGPGAIATAGSPGATLPRTGGTLGIGVLRLIAFFGLVRAGLGLVNQRRRAGGALGRTN